MRVVIFSFSNEGGGAHAAARRLHCALCSLGRNYDISSVLRTIKGREEVEAASIGRVHLKFHQQLLRSLRELLRKTLRIAYRLIGGRRVFSTASIFTGLGGALAEEQPELLVVNWLGDFTISIEELLSLDVPYVIRLSDHWAWESPFHFGPQKSRFGRDFFADRFLLNFLGRESQARGHLLVQGSRGLISPSTVTAALARKAFPQTPVVVVPNPIDTEQTWDKSKHGNSGPAHPAKFVVGFGADGGVSDPRKGFHVLTQALKILRQSNPETLDSVVLRIFGSKNHPRPSLPVDTEWFGFLDGDSLASFMSDLDLLVVPSTTETFGNLVLEAQSLGCPVIATKGVGAFNDIVIDGRTGFLFNIEPRGEYELAERIEWVLANPNWLDEAGPLAASHVKEKFSPAAVVKEFRKAIDVFL